MSACILFVADCGATVGGGHLMRCLTLAEALEARGARSRFVAGDPAAAVLGRFAPGADLVHTGDADDIEELVRRADAAATEWGADVVVLDHYRLAQEQQGRLRGGRRSTVISDLADRDHVCDLIVDASLGRSAEEYSGLAPAEAKVLTGPEHALVRRQFAARRARMQPERGDKAPRRALISLGLTDVDAITGRCLDVLTPLAGEIEIDVVVGSSAPSVRGLIDQAWSNRRLHVHVDTPDMAGLIAGADLAVGAGGSSVWERACLGLPSITLALADNQRELVRRLDDAGAAVALDPAAEHFEDALAGAWDRLVRDAELRARLSEVSAALCDGRGAERVAAAVMQLVG